MLNMADTHYLLLVSWTAIGMNFSDAKDMRLKRHKKQLDQKAVASKLSSNTFKNVLNSTGMTNHFHLVNQTEMLVMDQMKVHAFGLEKNDKKSTTELKAPYTRMNFYNYVEFDKVQIYFPREFFPMVYYNKEYVQHLNQKFLGKRKHTGFANTSLSAFRTRGKLYYMGCDEVIYSASLSKLLGFAKNKISGVSFNVEKEATGVIDFTVCSKSSRVFIIDNKAIILHNSNKRHIFAENEKCYAMAAVKSVLVAAVAIPLGPSKCFKLQYLFLSQSGLKPIAANLAKTVGAAFVLPQKIIFASLSIGEVVISVANFATIDLILLATKEAFFLKKDMKIAEVCFWTCAAIEIGEEWKILLGSNSGIYECKIPTKIVL